MGALQHTFGKVRQFTLLNQNQNWIMITHFWSDSKIWIDTAIWYD
jgi:hypothetical protein